MMAVRGVTSDRASLFGNRQKTRIENATKEMEAPYRTSQEEVAPPEDHEFAHQTSHPLVVNDGYRVYVFHLSDDKSSSPKVRAL